MTDCILCHQKTNVDASTPVEFDCASNSMCTMNVAQNLMSLAQIFFNLTGSVRVNAITHPHHHLHPTPDSGNLSQEFIQLQVSRKSLEKQKFWNNTSLVDQGPVSCRVTTVARRSSSQLDSHLTTVIRLIGYHERRRRSLDCRNLRHRRATDSRGIPHA